MRHFFQGHHGIRGSALAVGVLLAGALSAEAGAAGRATLEEEYHSGSVRAVARDAFPVLFNPSMGTVADGDKIIRPHEWVIGIAITGAAKAYPVAVMGFHELINDHLGGQPITVCW